MPNTSISARWHELDGLLPAAAGRRAACELQSEQNTAENLISNWKEKKNGVGVSVFSTWISLIFH